MLYALFALCSMLYEVSYLLTDRANTRGPSGPKNVHRKIMFGDIARLKVTHNKVGR